MVIFLIIPGSISDAARLSGGNRPKPDKYGKEKTSRPPPAGLKNRAAIDLAAEIKGNTRPSGADYRELSLKLHGLICAKCGREFDSSNRHLLTVHHKDGNHGNNPPDGSNWENLCIYCHDDEHSRGLLADYLREGRRDG